MIRNFASLVACPARRSRRAFPIPRRCARPSKRWPSFTASRSSAKTSSPSTSRFVDSVRSSSNAVAGPNRKKTAAAIHQEVAREINQLLGRVFAQRHKDGRTDLEAIESAMRAALHQAGAVALNELLQFVAPAADQRQSPCP